MKNFLNRLTRLMIIMLLLVDRTPFLNVHAVDQRDIDTNGKSPLFMLQIDTNGSINQGCGVGQYDHFVAFNDSVWDDFWDEFENEDSDPDPAVVRSFIRSLVVLALPEGDPDAGLNYELSGAKYSNENVTTVCVVAPYNVAPVAVVDTYNMQEDAVGGLNVAMPGVLSNDTDGNGDTITAELVTGPTVGTTEFAFNADGSFTFKPIANYFGDVTFTYKALDSRGAYSNIATVTIRIASVNDLPLASSESHTILRGGTVTDAVTGSDIETLPANLTFVIETYPTDFTSFKFNADGTFVYEHDITKSTTPVTFTFRAKDADGALSANVGTVTININNLAPSTNDRSFTTDEDVALNVNATDGLLRDSTDPENDPRTVDTTVGTAPTKGSVVLSADGSFVYTPSLNLNESDSFTYRVRDDKGAYSTYKTVTITINPVDDAPVAVNDTASTLEDTPVDIDVLANDTDVDGGTKSVSSFSNGTNGVVSKNLDGTLKYTPNANFNGSDSFTYTLNGGSTATVTVTVTAVDDAPVAVDDAATTDEDTAVDINVIANDTDIDGGPKYVASVTHGTYGTVVINDDGTLKYTPNANFNGSDSFTYTLNGGSTATVRVTVSPVNDAPVAVNDSASTLEDTPVDIDVLANDTDSDGGTKSVVNVTQGTNGSVVINSDGTVKYTPNANFNGSDSFTYSINGGSSATVTVTITAVDDAPVAVNDSASTLEDTPVDIDVLLNDTDIDGGPKYVASVTQGTNGVVTINDDGTVKYAPALSFSGTDSFTYTLNGGSTATVTVTVTAVEDVPVAVDDTATTPEDTPVDIDVLDNDTDVDGGLMEVDSVTQGANGTVAINIDGTVKYTPNANFNGIDGFSYTLNGGSTANVTVTVTAVDDDPVAVDDTATTPEDTPVDIDVLDNDTDVDGGLMEVDSVTQGANGTVAINLDGTVKYTPNANFNGSDSFTYTLNGGSSATVRVTVTAVEDAPVAVDDPDDEEIDAIETPEDTPLILDFDDLLANDYDPDDEIFFQPQMFMILLAPARSFDFNTAFSPSVGALSLDMTGRTVTFTPPLNYVGPATFQYTIIDEDDNVSEPATVFIEVTPVNDAPVASPLAFTIANAGSSTGQFIASDVDDTDLVFSLLAAPTNGSATVSPTGAYTYTHNGTATLSDSFTFSVTDGELSDTAVVTVTITAAPTPPPVPTNLPPVANALAFSIANGAVSTGTLTGSDPEGAPISFAIATLPANGSLTISPAGIYVYDHNGTATTTDSFTFTVSDGSLSATATVSITILPIPTPPPAGNTPPEVIDGVVSTPFGEVIDGSVAPLGSDADGDNLSFALVDGPTNGTLVFNPDGTYTYTPNDGFDGSDSFTFIANDGTDDSDTATLTINVLEEEVIVEEPETPLAAPDNNWLWWLLALLAGLLLWLLAFLRPNMKYTLSDKANNQKVVRRRLAKPDAKTMIVELNDKDMLGLTTIEVEFFKRLAKHCGDVTVKFMLKGTQVHSVTIPADIDDVFTTIIHL